MATILTGTRVIDLSDEVSGSFAARWLGMLGADVIKVEPPTGDRARRMGPRRHGELEGSALFAYLNSGKRSVVLDVEDTADHSRLSALLRTASVIIETSTPGAWAERGVDLDALKAARPELVICSVTPFGQTGPQARWRSSELISFAAGGEMMLCGDPDRPPLKTAGFQAHYQGALHAFSATLTALFAARRDGVGEHIDISLQEAQAASLEAAGPAAMVREVDAERAGNQARAVWGIYPCADGYVGVASMPRQTPSVYRCIGHPELIDSPVFRDLIANPEANEFVSSLIGEWTAARTARQVFDESHGHRAPFSLIPTPRELLDWEPMRKRGFWRDVDHPVLGPHSLPLLPFTVAGDRGDTTRAPLLGEHTAEVLSSLEPTPAVAGGAGGSGEARAALDGIRVLDLTQVWAGPYAARFLADMGADVIHIEGPDFPDAVRGVGRGPDPRSFNKAPYFNEYNRNKRGLALDLHRPEGMEAFRRLVKTADVVIENWSVGVSERLGMGYEELRALNPRIVFMQMPGFAQDAPESERVGFGPTIEQMGGLVALQGYEGGEPHKSGISYGDPTAGIAAAGAVALALLRREDTGKGTHLVIAQRDNIVSMVGEFMVAEAAGLPYLVRAENRDADAVPHNVYRTRDDSGRWQADALGNPIAELHDTWVAIAVQSDDEWARLRAVVGDARLDQPAYLTVEGRRAAEAEIDAVLAEWAHTRDPREVADALQAAGVAAHPVMSALMLVRDPHLAARGFYVQTVHPEAGEHRTQQPVWRMQSRPPRAPRSGPCFGEHNREVMREAGYSEAEIDSLEAAGILAEVPLTA
jgi:crotonobetainyl-CoA:carnitine CoA-transferase CaiB-like acyl-CoA transferase